MREKKTSRKTVAKPASVAGAPEGLGHVGVKWWAALSEQFNDPGPATRLRIEMVARAADRMSEASEEIRIHGINSFDRYNQCRPNPAVSTEDKARSCVLQGLRDLDKLSKKDGMDLDLAAFIEEVT